MAAPLHQVDMDIALVIGIRAVAGTVENRAHAPRAVSRAAAWRLPHCWLVT